MFVRKAIVMVSFFLILFAVSACKDPREKTVWDYVEGDNVGLYEFSNGVKALHQDLIKHGYMKDHDCDKLKCAEHHVNTSSDIARINKLLEDGSDK